jgi:glycosyltransferase involved in cell wall biosynthesis
MKLVAISRVRNEADIIEPFVRHHAVYFDKILILDDGSNDGTFDALRKLRAEALPLVVVKESAIGYEQSRYMTRLMQMAAHQFGADWVVPLDADEFIEPERGKTVAEILEGNQDELVAIPWHNFEWRPENDVDPEPNPVIKQRFRLPPRADHKKILIPRSLIGEKTVLDQGNHRLLHEDQISVGRPLQSIALCHFPVRSVVQYASKVAVGYLQYLSMPGWKGDYGFHYLEPFKTLLDGDIEALRSRMADDARYYSSFGEERHRIIAESRTDPLRYRGGAVRYMVSTSTLLQNVLHCADAIARNRAKLAQSTSIARDDRSCSAVLAYESSAEHEVPDDMVVRFHALQQHLTTVRRELERSIEDRSLLAERLAQTERALVEVNETAISRSIQIQSRTFRLSRRIADRLVRMRLRPHVLFDFLHALWRR